MGTQSENDQQKQQTENNTYFGGDKLHADIYRCAVPKAGCCELAPSFRLHASVVVSILFSHNIHVESLLFPCPSSDSRLLAGICFSDPRATRPMLLKKRQRREFISESRCPLH